jgi:heme exporter protein D
VKEFLAMGGYALYVWGAYGVTFALIALEIVLLMRRSRKARETQA